MAFAHSNFILQSVAHVKVEVQRKEIWVVDKSLARLRHRGTLGAD